MINYLFNVLVASLMTSLLGRWFELDRTQRIIVFFGLLAAHSLYGVCYVVVEP